MWQLFFIVLCFGFWGSWTTSLANDVVKIPIKQDYQVFSQDVSKVEVVPAYRYSYSDIIKEESDIIIVEEQGFRWRAGVTVPVYVDCNSTEQFEALVKKAIKIWDAVIPANLEYAGCTDVVNISNLIDNKDFPDEEAIYAIENTDLAIHHCGGIVSGCSPFLYLYSSPRTITKFYALMAIASQDFSCYGSEEMFFSTILHEMGHTLGLDHPFNHGEDNTLSVMNYYSKSTIYPTSNDYDVIQGLYPGIQNKYGEELTLETDLVPIAPPSNYSGCFYDTNFFPQEYTPVFCISGGVYPYKVVGANLIEDYDNIFCYQYSDLNVVKVYSADGQIYPNDNQNKDPGDINGDNTVNILDALLLARYVVGLLELPADVLSVADINCDNSVNIIDALFIARQALGLPTMSYCANI